MKFRFSLKRAILDILYIKEQVYEKFNSNEKYKPILDFLMAKDYLNDDDIPLPTFKEMEEGTGLKMYHLRKNLKDLYDEIFDWDNGVKFDFSKVEVYFFLSYFENYQSFICKNIGYIPRVGEDIDMPFVNAQLNTSYFYVDSVTCIVSAKSKLLKHCSFKRGICSFFYRHTFFIAIFFHLLIGGVV